MATVAAAVSQLIRDSVGAVVVWLLGGLAGLVGWGISVEIRTRANTQRTAENSQTLDRIYDELKYIRERLDRAIDG